MDEPMARITCGLPGRWQEAKRHWSVPVTGWNSCMTDTVSRSVSLRFRSTGITAGHTGRACCRSSVIRFIKRYAPFINFTREGAALANGWRTGWGRGQKPIVFATMVPTEINTLLKHASVTTSAVRPLHAGNLTGGARHASIRQSGISHGLVNPANYERTPRPSTMRCTTTTVCV